MFEKESQYYENLDFVKGILIILVILGHCIQCGSGSIYNQNQEFFENGLYRLIYSFHMPAFMIISAFLFGKTSQKRTFLQVFKTRTIRLLLPIVVWKTGITLLSIVRGRPLNLNAYFISIVESFWFLWSVWWATIICAFIESTCKYVSIRYLFHAVIIIITFITPDSFNFSCHKFMYISFLLGYIAGKYNYDNYKIDGKKKYIVLCVMLMIFITLLVFFRKGAYIYISGWTLLRNDSRLITFLWDIYRTIIGVIGSSFIIYLTYIFLPNNTGGVLKKLGKKTSGIYILQTYLNIIMLTKLSTINHNIWLNILETIVILLICYLGTVLVSYVPFASLLLFGQKEKKRCINE